MKTASAIALAALPALLLSSCTTTGKTAIDKAPAVQSKQDGYNYITPQSNVDLGRAYRSVVPLSKNRMPELTPICPDDFKETQALRDLQAKYASAPETSGVDETTNETEDGKFGLDGIRFSWLTLGAHVAPGSTTKVAFTGVTWKALEDEDENLVWQNLGPKCRELIETRKKAGYAVYIPTRLHKAADVNITTEVRTEVEVAAGFNLPILKKTGASGEHKKTSTHTFAGKNMYFKLLSSDIPAQ